MSNWFTERRLDYVDFRMVTKGHIRREDILRTFGVTVVVASKTLTEFQRRYPKALVYDKSKKRYVPCRGYQTRRKSFASVEAAMHLLRQAKHPLGWE